MLEFKESTHQYHQKITYPNVQSLQDNNLNQNKTRNRDQKVTTNQKNKHIII